MKGRECALGRGWEREAARQSCGGCGGAGLCQRRRAGAQKEEQTQRAPGRAGHSGAPAAASRPGLQRVPFWVVASNALKLRPREGSPAPAGWGSWRGTGLRRGGDTGWGWPLRFWQQRETGKAWFGGLKIACSASGAAAEMNSSFEGDLKINEDIRRRSELLRLIRRGSQGRDAGGGAGPCQGR